MIANRKKYKTVIFDLDGTLLNTIDDLKDSLNMALQQFQCKERTHEEVLAFVGNGVKNLVMLAVEGGTAHPQFDQIYDAFLHIYKENCLNKTKPYDGIMDLLSYMKAEGYHIAIVSNKADFAVKELNHHFFQDISCPAFGENEVQKRKPAPDMVLNVMKFFQSEKNETVYIGDSEVDILTARNAGVDCISVAWGFRSEEYLKEQGAARIIQRPEELRQYI